MNVSLWVVQVVLAVVFAVSGSLKVSQSKEKMLASGQTGVAPFPLPVIRIVAALELAAVVGLMAPRLVGTAEILTPLAATGLAVVMVGAAVSHTSLREYKQAFGVNLGLLLGCLFVMAGRF